MTRRNGMALALALMAIVVLHSLVTVSLWAALHHARSVAAVRLAIEGEIVASSALAVARIAHDSTLSALSPGGSVNLPDTSAGEWQVRLSARRADAVVFLEARVELRTGSDSLIGAAVRTLVLASDAADTLRVLRGRSRF